MRSTVSQGVEIVTSSAGLRSNRDRQRRYAIARIGDTGLWLGFVAFVAAMLAVDLGLFQRRAHQPSTGGLGLERDLGRLGTPV